MVTEIVQAAAVNPADTVLRAGRLRHRMSPELHPPYIPGVDVAGVADEVGEGVRYAIGELCSRRS